MSKIKVFHLDSYTTMPEKGSLHAVGFDIYSNLSSWALDDYKKENLSIDFNEFLRKYTYVLEPQERVAIPTGLVMELACDMEMDIKSRSGLFMKNGILAQGTIDPDYRGEIKIMLFNLSKDPFTIKHKERVAQAVFRTVHNPNDLFLKVQKLEDLSNTERNTKGFGSTGLS